MIEGAVARRILRDLISLVVGAVFGAILGATIVLGPLVFEGTIAAVQAAAGSKIEGLTSIYVDAVWRMSFICAAFIAAVASPIWLFGAKFSRNTPLDAALLGAALGAAVGYCMIHTGSPDWSQFAETVLFGLTGAASGVLVRWISHASQIDPRTRRSA